MGGGRDIFFYRPYARLSYDLCKLLAVRFWTIFWISGRFLGIPERFLSEGFLDFLEILQDIPGTKKFELIKTSGEPSGSPRVRPYGKGRESV